MANQAMRLIEFMDLQTIKDALCTGLAFYDSYGERQIHPSVSGALDIVNAAMKMPEMIESQPSVDPRIASFDEWLNQEQLNYSVGGMRIQSIIAGHILGELRRRFHV